MVEEDAAEGDFGTRLFQSVQTVVPTDEIGDLPQLMWKFNKEKVTDLNVTEGTVQFSFWFAVSSYLPLFTACSGPLANMISIAALVSGWRRLTNGVEVRDPKSAYILNAISLGLGAISNISVILNFNRLVSYVLCQVVSCVGFFIGSVLLLSGILVVVENHMQPEYQYTEAFWFAVLTCIFYFICSASCFLNFLGFLLGKYPADFNLDRAERGLIIYTFLVAVWFSWGSVMFSCLMDGLTYPNALYFCVQSLLTIGLGDIAPQTNLTQGLLIVYSFSGFILIGLIVVMISSTIVSVNIPVLFWNQIEIRRQITLKKITDNNIKLSPQDSFDLMRAVKNSARRYQSNFNTLITILVWATFWLIGSLVFYFTEDWTYFNAVYFCFLCWLTIGYGTLAPKSPAGRSFFVVWALAAVPLMTVLISDIGDRILKVVSHDKIFRKLFNRTKRKAMEFMDLTHNKDLEREIDENEVRTVDEIITGISRHNSMVSFSQDTETDQAKALITYIRNLMVEARKSPKKKYEYKYWETVLDIIDLEEHEKELFGLYADNFWLSDYSPLRSPINESDYLLFALFGKLETFVLDKFKELAKYQDDDPEYQGLKKRETASTNDNNG